MKIINTTLEQISKDEFLRCDAKFYTFFEKAGWNLFEHSGKLIKLKDVLIDDRNLFELEDDEEYFGIPTGQTYVDEDGEIISYNLVNKDNIPNRLKYKINEKNILISSLKFAKAPATSYQNIDFDKYIFSNGFHILKIKNDWELRFVVYILKHSKVKNLIDNHICRGIGISSYRLDDLLNVEVPNISIPNQLKIINMINPIELEIKNLKESQNNLNEIIDNIFSDLFSFDYNKFEKLKTIKIFNTPFEDFSNDVDTRFSAKFHRPAGKYVIDELNRISTKKIKNFIQSPIMTGKGISPKDYDVDGSFRYASMADISSWFIDIGNMKTVSDAYVEKNSTKRPRGCKEDLDTTIQKGDILMIRSGEGSIGKVALVEDEVNAIFSDFVIRIRFENYNSKFAYYYFRTTYFQYLIEIYKKGLGNNTNIFPIVLQDLPIPNISIEEQDKIVDIINNKLEENNIIRNKIRMKRQEIENIMINQLKELG